MMKFNANDLQEKLKFTYTLTMTSRRSVVIGIKIKPNQKTGVVNII